MNNYHRMTEEDAKRILNYIWSKDSESCTDESKK